MPRADPTRSDYCASRHLLRNLGDAAELRRNPLARKYFRAADETPHRRDDDRAALARLRDDVRASLARCSEFARDRSSVALGRMHGALLRCDIDDQPAPAVAAELGLSERQLRRERRAAHDAFARAFRAPLPSATQPATVCDVATVRLAEAVELHELGQPVLAQAELASIAANAPAPGLRIEALCLAAEAEFDAVRLDAAAAHLAGARALMVRHARELDDHALRAADEHVDLVAWLLRWQTATCDGLATQPPLALAPLGDDRARDESRRALFARAAAAYGMQRCGVGDYDQGSAIMRRALHVLPTLHAARAKEQLAVMLADTHVFGLRAPLGADHERFCTIERVAAAHGHVRTMLTARSERIAAETALRPGRAGRVFDDMLRPFGPVERRTMARAFAWVAHTVAQYELNPRDTVASAQLVEMTVPARSVIALASRCMRADVATDARRYDEARVLAQSVYADAELIGNRRVRGAAARSLAAIELGCRRRSEAQRYVREAMALSERYGSRNAFAKATALARRLDVG